MYENPARSRTLLSGRAQASADRSFHSQLKVRVRKNDHRIFAAHLQLIFSAAFQRLPSDQLANLIGAGEGDRLDIGMVRQSGTD